MVNVNTILAMIEKLLGECRLNFEIRFEDPVSDMLSFENTLINVCKWNLIGVFPICLLWTNVFITNPEQVSTSRILSEQNSFSKKHLQNPGYSEKYFQHHSWAKHFTMSFSRLYIITENVI